MAQRATLAGAWHSPAVRGWLRVNLGTILSYLGIALSCVVLAIMIIRAISRGEGHYVWANSLPMLYVIGLLTLVTTTVRTVGWRLITRAFFMGVFAHMAVAYPLNRIMKIPFGENDFTAAVWVPLMEELTRLGLLVLVCWLLTRRTARRPGLADMMVLGAVMGLGFSLHEDMLYPRAMAIFPSGSPFEAFTQPWGWLYPTAAHVYGSLGLGHLSAGIGVGIAAGLFFTFSGTMRSLGLLLGAGLWAMEVAYHGIWNATGLPAALQNFVIATEPWVHLLLIIGAISFDLWRRTIRPPATARPARVLYGRAHHNAESPLRWVERMMSASRFRREYNAGAYARAFDPALPDLAGDRLLLHWYLTATRPTRQPSPPPAQEYGIVPGT